MKLSGIEYIKHLVQCLAHGSAQSMVILILTLALAWGEGRGILDRKLGQVNSHGVTKVQACLGPRDLRLSLLGEKFQANWDTLVILLSWSLPALRLVSSFIRNDWLRVFCVSYVRQGIGDTEMIKWKCCSQRNWSLVKSLIFKYNNDDFFEVTKLTLKSVWAILNYLFPDWCWIHLWRTW